MLPKQLTDIYQLDAEKHKSYIAPDSWVIDKNNILWVTFPGYGLKLDQDNDLWMSSHLGISQMDSETHYLKLFTYDDDIGLRINFSTLDFDDQKDTLQYYQHSRQ